MSSKWNTDWVISNMDIRIYIGPHRTASQHISEILEKNAKMLKDQKVSVVSSIQHRHLLRDLTLMAEGDTDYASVLEKFIEEKLKGETPDHLVIFDHRICGSVTRPIGGSFVYPTVSSLVKKHEKLFANYQRTYFCASRNFPSFLGSCYSESLTHAKIESFEEFISGFDINELRWSDTFARILRSMDDEDPFSMKLVTWKFEDYPEVWRQVVQVLTGIENGQDLKGTSKPINLGLSLYGSQLMYRFLKERPPAEPGDFDKVRNSFIKKFPSNKIVEDEPFWTNTQLEDFKDRYEDDMYYVSRMEGIASISAPPKV